MLSVSLVLYLTAVFTCLACTVLLYRGYRNSRLKLLLWSTLCFVGLSISNVLLFFDLVVFPVEIDLRAWRLGTALAGLLFLLYGFIWEADREDP
jgi:hypothetical protein